LLVSGEGSFPFTHIAQIYSSLAAYENPTAGGVDAQTGLILEPESVPHQNWAAPSHCSPGLPDIRAWENAPDISARFDVVLPSAQ